LDILTAPTDVPGRARRARFPDRELLRAWYRAFAQEADERIAVLDDAVDAALKIPGCWLWVDANGVIVSMATRRPMMTWCAREGPVYTASRWRGRGYGSAVTAAATRHILDDGGVPVLFTDLTNRTTNDIYQRLGYRPVEDRLEIEFQSVETIADNANGQPFAPSSVVAALVKVPVPRAHRAPVWTVEEARAFLESARTANDPFYAAYVLMLVLGLRRGEMFGLAWSEVDLEPARPWSPGTYSG
jgi:GNAT superfamily N-acetyltransferase